MKLTILVLEDEPEVRDAIERDLAELAGTVRIEPAEDAEDAWDVVADVVADGDLLALVLADHRLPGTTGVDFLVELVRDERAAWARTVLLTGQADQADTIKALNQAGLSHYLAKPWDPDELRAVVRALLTDVVGDAGLDPLPHMAALDAERAMEFVSRSDR